MTKTRTIISETIIGKDEPLQPFRSAMTQDTEDVVALLAKLKQLESDVQFYSGNEASGYAEIARLKAQIADKAVPAIQSLSDRIDVQLDALKSAEAWLDRWAPHVGGCRGSDQCTCGLVAIRGEVSAALHQEATDVGR